MSSDDVGQPLSTPDGARAVLTSWKEIAAHLRVSVKTAQRYETEMGLPVRRLSGRVSISVAELQEWQESQTTQPKVENASWWMDPIRLRAAFLVCAGLLTLGALAAAVSYLRNLPGPPATAEAEGLSLVARDAAGKMVWQHLFSVQQFAGDYGRKVPVRFVDLNGDGAIETLAVWQHVRRDLDGWPLRCFGIDGKIHWALDVQDVVRNAAGKQFAPPYVIRDYEVFDSPDGDSTKWVAAVFVHVADVVSTLVVVDAAGKRRGQYWHVGHLNGVRMFDTDGDGKNEIVAGGVRHGVDQAVLVAFDPGRVSGASPMPAGHSRSLVGQPASSEVRTGFVARSTVSKELAVFNFISRLEVAHGLLQAQVYESLFAPEGYLMYEFEPGLKVHDITLSAAYGEVHHVLQRTKKLGDLFPEQEVARLRSEFRIERGSADDDR